MFCSDAHLHGMTCLCSLVVVSRVGGRTWSLLLVFCGDVAVVVWSPNTFAVYFYLETLGHFILIMNQFISLISHTP